tara:strand:- start:86 stop:571 length:486 start_codon:yes stop_codon:yes gene_type:complete
MFGTFGQQNPFDITIPKRNTFCQPQGTAQPVTFGQQPTAQPVTFGHPQNTAQPVTFVRPGLTTALTFGQSVTFGQSQPTAQALTFGQSQPTTHPLNETATIHEYSVPKTIVYARVVYDIGTRQNYDHMSGEEYLLQNDLSLSIDYCEQIQRELQKKNKYSL